MAKQVIDIHPGKGMSTSQSNEHLRNAGSGERLKNWSGNYDPSREHLNFEITKGGIVIPVDKKKSIPRSISEILKARNIVDPNKVLLSEGRKTTRRTVANIILGGSREQMHRLAFGEQYVVLEPKADNSSVVRMPDIENWAKDMYRFMSEKFGEENIARFVVHLDETNPHVHCTMLPITERNKFSWNQYFGAHKQDGIRIYSELHDQAAIINEKYGLDRGDRVADTGARHRSTEEYHKALRKEMMEKNKKLHQEVMDNERTIEEQKLTISSLDKEVKHASARCKALHTMMTHLERRKSDLENEIGNLKAELAVGKISKGEADQKMKLLAIELEKVNNNILDKEGKLHIAEEQLASLRNRTQEQETKYQEVEEKLNTANDQFKSQTVKEMQTYGYNLMVAQLMTRKERYDFFKKSLSDDEQANLDKAASILFDGTLMEKSASEIVAVSHIATALFLGYLDKATAIAESHGGGGGPGTGWGKKDDEDDNAFRRRCFGMALMMMQPSRGRKIKR